MNAMVNGGNVGMGAGMGGFGGWLGGKGNQQSWADKPYGPSFNSGGMATR